MIETYSNSDDAVPLEPVVTSFLTSVGAGEGLARIGFRDAFEALNGVKPIAKLSDELFTLADANRDGRVDVAEFTALLMTPPASFSDRTTRDTVHRALAIVKIAAMVQSRPHTADETLRAEVELRRNALHAGVGGDGAGGGADDGGAAQPHHATLAASMKRRELIQARALSLSLHLLSSSSFFFLFSSFFFLFFFFLFFFFFFFFLTGAVVWRGTDDLAAWHRPERIGHRRMHTSRKVDLRPVRPRPEWQDHGRRDP